MSKKDTTSARDIDLMESYQATQPLIENSLFHVFQF